MIDYKKAYEELVEEIKKIDLCESCRDGYCCDCHFDDGILSLMSLPKLEDKNICDLCELDEYQCCEDCGFEHKGEK